MFKEERTTRVKHRELTPFERNDCLLKVQQDLREFLQEWALFRPQGGADCLLSDFRFSPQYGTLTAQAPNSGCRITIYFEGLSDGAGTVPYAVTEISGTCRDFRRHASCSHVVAATKKLITNLDTKKHPLRRELFHLQEFELWRTAFDTLDRFLAANTQDSAQTENTPATRIVWRVEFEVSPAAPPAKKMISLDVFPVEQKIGKNGQWTKGRRLRIEDLNRLDTSLGEVERRIAAKQFQRLYGYGSYLSDYEPISHYDTLAELVGCSHVTWADQPQTPVDIVWGQFNIVVGEVEGGWRVLPGMDGEVRPNEMMWDQFGPTFRNPLWIDRKGNRVVLAKVDPKIVTLVSNLSATPEPIPPAAQPALLNKLALVQRHVPVVLPERFQAGKQAANRRLILRLTPENSGGATAELAVAPTADNQLFAPGAGPQVLTELRDGRQFAHERDLVAERDRARHVADHLGLNLAPSQRPWFWRLPTNDDLLDLLSKLRDEPLEDLVVQWPDGAMKKVTGIVQPAALRVQISEQRDWFGISGAVEIDGEQVELAHILAALKSGRRYVQLGENQFVRLATALRQSLEAIDDASHATKDGRRELDLTAAPVLEELCDPTVELKACLAWEESLRKLHAAQDLHPEPPITLQADLRDYQVEGFRWLARLAAWGMGGCLADDMGLGKTVQTLAVLIARQEEGPALVVAPTSVAFNWAREAERFAPTLRPVLYRETDRDDVLQQLGPGDLLIVSYGLLLRDIKKLSGVHWGTLVLDEAQKIKNAVTKTAQAVRQLDAKWRLALTGTPLENHLGELWSIFRAVCPGLFGSWDRFRGQFADPIERFHDPDRRRALARIIRPFILRRTKAEVLTELPPRTEIIRTAELTAVERERYDAARLAAVADLVSSGAEEGEDRRFQVLAALTRLRQLACHPKLVDPDWPGDSAKLELFMEIVEELREGRHRALVFSQFVQHLSLLRGALDAAGVTYQYLDGQTPPAEREKRVDAFQRGEGELFLISLKAGGTGLNLTAADYVIHTDPWWNPAVEDQATDRTHRIGQTRPVTVYRLVAKGTIEEQILSLHASKRALVADVLTGSDQAAKLSSEELISLMRGGETAETVA